MLFKIGLTLYIKSDSKIRKSFLLHWAKILKLSLVGKEPHCSEWRRIAEWGGLERGLLVRELNPRCSAILSYRLRDVIPTYADVHCTQLYWYIREERRTLGRVSLYRKKEPILKSFVKIMDNCILGKYFLKQLWAVLIIFGKCL